MEFRNPLGWAQKPLRNAADLTVKAGRCAMRLVARPSYIEKMETDRGDADHYQDTLVARQLALRILRKVSNTEPMDDHNEAGELIGNPARELKALENTVDYGEMGFDKEESRLIADVLAEYEPDS